MGLDISKIQVIDANEEYLVKQVTRYLKLAKTTISNDDLSLGWISRAEKTIGIAGLIQEENLRQ